MLIRIYGLLGLVLCTGVASAQIGHISTLELAAKLDEASVAVLDVRKADSWRFSNQKIKSAVRVDSHDIPTLSTPYDKDTTLVLYCD